jgi:hypothetical protein
MKGKKENEGRISKLFTVFRKFVGHELCLNFILTEIKEVGFYILASTKLGPLEDIWNFLGTLGHQIT